MAMLGSNSTPDIYVVHRQHSRQICYHLCSSTSTVCNYVSLLQLAPCILYIQERVQHARGLLRCAEVGLPTSAFCNKRTSTIDALADRSSNLEPQNCWSHVQHAGMASCAARRLVSCAARRQARCVTQRLGCLHGRPLYAADRGTCTAVQLVPICAHTACYWKVRLPASASFANLGRANADAWTSRV